MSNKLPLDNLKARAAKLGLWGLVAQWEYASAQPRAANYH